MIFSRHSLLVTSYGEQVARAIQNRLAIIVAADHLAMIPSEPPISCRSAGRAGRFCVALPGKQVLGFSPVPAQLHWLGATDGLKNITEVQVEGVTDA